MSKLKERDLQIDNVIKMIAKIENVDVVGYDCYKKSWIKTKLREDVIEENFNIDNFGNFVINKVLKDE